jgi:hypothetical protein
VAPPDYHVRTTWEVEATLDEAVAILREPASLARWWPAAFLDVTAGAGPADAPGSAGRVHSKGWLPYTLAFDFDVMEQAGTPEVVVRVAGDFEGRCVATVTAREPRLAIVFDWRVAVHKPVIRRWSWLLRRVFVANHLWVMRRGLESFRLELARRRGDAGTGLDAPVPAPPGPTFPYGPRYHRLRLMATRLWSAWPRWTGPAGLGEGIGG